MKPLSSTVRMGSAQDASHHAAISFLQAMAVATPAASARRRLPPRYDDGAGDDAGQCRRFGEIWRRAFRSSPVTYIIIPVHSPACRNSGALDHISSRLCRHLTKISALAAMPPTAWVTLTSQATMRRIIEISIYVALRQQTRFRRIWLTPHHRACRDVSRDISRAGPIYASSHTDIFAPLGYKSHFGARMPSRCRALSRATLAVENAGVESSR